MSSVLRRIFYRTSIGKLISIITRDHREHTENVYLSFSLQGEDISVIKTLYIKDVTIIEEMGRWDVLTIILHTYYKIWTFITVFIVYFKTVLFIKGVQRCGVYLFIVSRHRLADPRPSFDGPSLGPRHWNMIKDLRDT